MALDFDIVVIGGGHAGAEAAWAASGLSCATALVTLDASVIARMSCNPAIGGVGKGQIVREIDAMGGLMGLAADATGIQFRMLNRSKGAAVWGPRCQSDRHAYAAWVQRALGERKNLTILEGEATDVIVEDGHVAGVRIRPNSHANRVTGQHPQANSALEGGTDGESIDLRCRAVIVTAGTFLNGVMHLGERTWAGGRYDEPAATGLTASLASLGLEFGRLKTGTCARLDAATIDYDKCTRQDGDAEPEAFSFMTARLSVEQIPCWITWTNRDVHDAIRANFHRAPMYTGQIQSTGPRYCPSIETKIDRFADKDRHQIFLEREGRTTDWVYCNGISTSLPPDVQDFMIHHIAGLERARIIRYGYAIEYDYFPPTQLAAALEVKGVGGLYLAGQVNGTTGYEEAAAQGLLAGLNAALALRGDRPLVLRRDQAYIGVMIDDLVTKGVSEPYRMFTSRAEHRLSLRADNADRRLTPVGRSVGLVDDARWARHQAALEAVMAADTLLRNTRVAGKSLWETLRRPDADLAGVLALAGPDVRARFVQLLSEQPDAVNSLVIDGRYEGYREKEASALRHMQDLDRKLLPVDINYNAISHLRHEAREKLSACRPHSLGQALRISGITPADVTVLAVHLMGRNVKMDNL
ncbi:MAG: tRNA uridine 5-carboxymethylaminomethyl modification enzyme MnmG [Planctomycetes bacterium ADurb.Bin126]|nr:MAG: tRNA uridine 5-carboxymethylaminomethyl modification enzyme MnmG [Planctomycetes bacterium ADurb.Bin126]HOD84415.1 tRNA uridine-5-carboxymethylaminomethyl(34) synthesis enzyme MnmG [Phycisphaerae bacterium]HQL73861.1 tRNA uridine-5-carboxymethylaminomethyl(34) synthesis enzyme MnmG [Phycisphaerae bacterium]